MFDSSVIELSKSALHRNLRFLQKAVGAEVLISSVIKGNAYGHGIDPFVPLAESCGLRHFSVFDASEAYRVRQCQTNPSTQVMIMGFADSDGLAWSVEHGVSFYVFDIARLEEVRELARRIGVPAHIHLELETGMNRTGIRDADLLRATQYILRNQDCLRLEGVCTHFAGAETVANYKRVQDQTAEFQRMCDKITAEGLAIPLRHSASSAAALTYPETRMDMVRIGIAQYGFWPSKETEMQHLLGNDPDYRKHYIDPLRRVLRWSSRVMHIASVEAGQFVGYGTMYMTPRPQKVATIPVGYSHGFRRSLSNLGRVLIRGKRANVVGVVNMSMIQVDVTSIPSVEVGDEAVIIGKQKKARISVGSFSDMANLLNYEMLVRLPTDIRRVVVN
ncbi:MAG: alanine racemase [candidate division Zixibacteria bacterium]|nr:alanine racemase [candidate division Zixibacteria bacterium]